MKTKNAFLIFFLFSLIFSGCVKDEVFEGPPTITDITITPQAPSENQPALVKAKIVDLNGMKQASVYYMTAQKAYTRITMTAGSGGYYTAEIPGQASGVTVNYYIEAVNETDQKAWYPVDAPKTTASYTVGAPLILMNEIYSRGTAEDPDWVEVYNASDVAVDITDYAIYDAGGQTGAKPKLKFPSGSVVPAKGFLVIVTDIGGDTGFGLSSAGEEIWLENASGSLIDNIAFGAMDVTQSWGRNPDGGLEWALLNTVTRGSANSTTLPDPVLFINEIYSRGDALNPDWIEIYNSSPFDANVSGYKVYDADGHSGAKPKLEIPAGTVIPAKGFFVVVTDNGSAAGFGLSSNGEQVWLERNFGSVIDEVIFPALQVGQSFGRYPDGSATLQVFNVVTRGSANDNTTPPPAVQITMNEIFSRGTTDNPDWIEIYNASANAIDIGGYKIYDSGGQGGTKPKKEIPSGTSLTPGGFFVIVVDDTTASGFGLSSGGEKVWLENNSGAVIDTISFPALDVTQSYGRKPDGSANLVIFTEVTKGTSNNNAASLPKKKSRIPSGYIR